MGVLYAKVSGSWVPILNQSSGGGDGEGAKWDPGDIKASVAGIAPAGWLTFNQAIPGADTLYPALWAVVPASWKSGTTLNLPNVTDCTLLGGGTLGTVGGANSRTLTEANLANHDHTLSSHTHAGAAHTHTINHDHATGTTSTQAAHQHTIEGGGTDGTAAYVRTASGGLGATPGTNAAGSHNHTLNLPSYSGNSGGASATTTGGPSSNLTSAVGSGTAFDTTPKHLRVNWIIKT